MRRLFAALMLALVAVILVACGGAPAETAATPAPEEVAAAPAGPPKATPPADLSPTEVANNEQMPTQPDAVPEAVLNRLKAKQPMLIFYYDSTMVITKDERHEVDTVVKQYRGLIDLLAYDENLALKSSEPSSTQKTELQKAMVTAGLVGVKHAPYILFVDRAGRITGRFAGFADEELLEREVLRATGG